MAEEEEEEEEKDSQEGVKNKAKQVYLPGGALQEGEELVHDSSTYRMYHVVCILLNTNAYYYCFFILSERCVGLAHSRAV